MHFRQWDSAWPRSFLSRDKCELSAISAPFVARGFGHEEEVFLVEQIGAAPKRLWRAVAHSVSAECASRSGLVRNESSTPARFSVRFLFHTDISLRTIAGNNRTKLTPTAWIARPHREEEARMGNTPRQRKKIKRETDGAILRAANC